MLNTTIIDMSLEIMDLILQPHLPGTNELNFPIKRCPPQVHFVSLSGSGAEKRKVTGIN